MMILPKQIAQNGAGRGAQVVWNSTLGLWVPELPTFYTQEVSASNAISYSGTRMALVANMTVTLPAAGTYLISWSMLAYSSSSSRIVNLGIHSNSTLVLGTWSPIGPATSNRMSCGSMVLTLSAGTVGIGWWTEKHNNTGYGSTRKFRVVQNAACVIV